MIPCIKNKEMKKRITLFDSGNKKREKNNKDNPECYEKIICVEEKKVHECKKILQSNMLEKLAMSFDLFKLGLSDAAIDRILNIKKEK